MNKNLKIDYNNNDCSYINKNIKQINDTQIILSYCKNIVNQTNKIEIYGNYKNNKE